MPSTYEGFTGGAPASRIRAANDKPINAHAHYAYWMIAARRSSSNFALDRAIAWVVELGLPVVVLETLSVDSSLLRIGCTDSSSTGWRIPEVVQSL